MTDIQYKRAPITEAVVEFKSSSPIDENKRQKALKKLGRLYANYKPITQKNIKLEVGSDGDPKAEANDSILDKFSSTDMTQQLHITDISFVILQLAPYCGWEQFEQRIKRDWETWRKVVNFQTIERLGMRYINRIDIPITEPVVYYENYLEVYPKLPGLLDPCTYHSLNVRAHLKEIEGEINLRSAVVESPLPNHMAIVLDLDIARIFQTPPSDVQLYAFINDARVKKNEIFEACITDKARELFNK